MFNPVTSTCFFCWGAPSTSFGYGECPVCHGASEVRYLRATVENDAAQFELLEDEIETLSDLVEQHKENRQTH